MKTSIKKTNTQEIKTSGLPIEDFNQILSSSITVLENDILSIHSKVNGYDLDAWLDDSEVVVEFFQFNGKDVQLSKEEVSIIKKLLLSSLESQEQVEFSKEKYLEWRKEFIWEENKLNQ